jgi:hypothetical protein
LQVTVLVTLVAELDVVKQMIPLRGNVVVTVCLVVVLGVHVFEPSSPSSRSWQILFTMLLSPPAQVICTQLFAAVATCPVQQFPSFLSDLHISA